MKDEMPSAEIAKCWRVKRHPTSKPITICEGETAYEHGDESVGIHGGEVTVKRVLGGKHGASVEVQYGNEEPYEEELRMFEFAEELQRERISDLEMGLESVREDKEEELDKLREEYKTKYGENFKEGQRVTEVLGNKRGKILSIDRSIEIKVKWDKEKKPVAKTPGMLIDEKEWDKFNKEFDEYTRTHDVMLEAKDESMRRSRIGRFG
jgi:hypothetical protein